MLLGIIRQIVPYSLMRLSQILQAQDLKAPPSQALLFKMIIIKIKQGVVFFPPRLNEPGENWVIGLPRTANHFSNANKFSVSQASCPESLFPVPSTKSSFLRRGERRLHPWYWTEQLDNPTQGWTCRPGFISSDQNTILFLLLLVEPPTTPQVKTSPKKVLLLKADISRRLWFKVWFEHNRYQIKSGFQSFAKSYSHQKALEI